MSFFFSFPNEGIFFGSTPERLLQLNGKYFETEALAGTISRGKNMEEDRLLADKLRGSHKEGEEHRFVLEQILRKLGPITDQLDFGKYPEILKLKNVQHLKTKIHGKLKTNTHILKIVNQLHPTPAVAGTPLKHKV
jgi:menaquinone-specific isochorismate synthase